MVWPGFLQQLSAVLNPEDTEHNLGEGLKRLSGGRVPSRVICTGHRCSTAALSNPKPHVPSSHSRLKLNRRTLCVLLHFPIHGAAADLKS